MIRAASCTALLSLMLSAPSLADDSISDVYKLDLRQLMDLKVVVAASGYEQKIKNAPASVTVIEAQEWQARGAKNLTEALSGVAGVQPIMNQVGPTTELFAIRGLVGSFGQQVKIMVDGRPINRIYDSAPGFGFRMGLDGFKRIEVIRSSGSATYGADAFAGIINLVSYGKGELQDKLVARAGSFNSKHVSVDKSYQSGDIYLALSASYGESDGDKSRIVKSDLQTTFDQLFGSNASLAPAVFPSSYKSAKVNARVDWRALSARYFTNQNVSYDFGSGTAQALDRRGEGASRVHLVNVDYDLSRVVDTDLAVSYFHKYVDSKVYFYIFPPGTRLPINSAGNIDFVDGGTPTHFIDGYIGAPYVSSRTNRVELTHQFKASQSHQIRWQVGYEHQDFTPQERKNFGLGVIDGSETQVSGQLSDVTGTPFAFMQDRTRNFSFISLLDEWHVSRNFDLNLGIRYDDYSDFGSVVNYRLGAVWEVAKDLRIKGYTGTAFRAPSLNELYVSNNPAAIGNANLGSEEITTNEINLSYQLEQTWWFNFSLYKFKAEDLIEFVPDVASGNSYAQNVAKIDGQGAEFEVTWKPSEQLKVSANFSLLDSENVSGEKTPNMAEQMASLNVHYQATDKLAANLSLQAVNDRPRRASDNRNPVEDYVWVNAKISYQELFEQVDLGLTVNNLLDEDAVQPSSGSIPDDYPMEGRSVHAEVNVTF